MAKGAKTGGRKPGTPNKATADIRVYAAQYSEQAVDALFQIMQSSSSDPARVAAANSILDRAHGKPPQALDINGSIAISHEDWLARIAAGPDEPDDSGRAATTH